MDLYQVKTGSLKVNRGEEAKNKKYKIEYHLYFLNVYGQFT